MKQRIGLGGGCHWCTEAVFQAVAGVQRVDQGFLWSTPPADQPSEGVLVLYDTDHVSLDTLIAVHLQTHASRSQHALRGKYRSAIYAPTASLAKAARQALARCADDAVITRVLPMAGFSASPERYRNYYARDPQRPFCQRYIAPKLALLAGQNPSQTTHHDGDPT